VIAVSIQHSAFSQSHYRKGREGRKAKQLCAVNRRIIELKKLPSDPFAPVASFAVRFFNPSLFSVSQCLRGEIKRFL
jgi:hypothetical protein